MKKNYSNERSISVATQKFSTHSKKYLDSNLSSHPSQILPTTCPSEYQVDFMPATKLQGIFSIINIHFPKYFPIHNPGILAGSINLRNYQEILNSFCRQIKEQHIKQVKRLQEEFRSLEMELALVRNGREDAFEKIRGLEKTLKEKEERIKSRQLDCFGQSEELFKVKQRNQELERKFVLKNLQIKEIYKQFQKFKEEAYIQIQKHQALHKKLASTNSRHEQKIYDLQRKIKNLQQYYEKQMTHLRDLLRAQQINNLKYQCLPPPLQPEIFQCSSYRDSQKRSPTFCSDILSKNTFSNSTDIARSRSNSINNHTQRSRVADKSHPLNEQLLTEIKQLKQNQSALLDRLAERDELIQNLQHQISNSNSMVQ